MDAQEFNTLLKLYKQDKDAAYKLYTYCLAVIKARLLFRNESANVTGLSHSILEKIIITNPIYISCPAAYLNKCVDNFLSNRKKRKKREVALVQDMGYEPYFEQLEKFDVYNRLVEYVGELNAKIFYMYAVENAKEYEIAERLGVDMSYDAIRKRISRLKKELQKFFK